MGKDRGTKSLSCPLDEPIGMLVAQPPGDSGLDLAQLSLDGHLRLCPLTDHIVMLSAQPEL